MKQASSASRLSQTATAKRAARTRQAVDALVPIAATCISQQIGPEVLVQVIRRAFVKAAADNCQKKNGTVNVAQVSAVTGLPRISVKRLLNDSTFPHDSVQTPIQRVAAGWCRDREFGTKKGQPRTLRISGRGPTFANLAKKYGGDIPPSAILTAMLQAKLVTAWYGTSGTSAIRVALRLRTLAR